MTKPQVQSNQITQVMEKSVCLVLAFSRLGVSRSVGREKIKARKKDDTRDVPIEVDADVNFVRVNKDLLDSPSLRAMLTWDYETRREVARRCVPAPMFKHSVYLLPEEMLIETYEYLEDRKKGRDKLFTAFKTEYPTKIREAKKALKDLFDASEYPNPDVLKAHFDMSWAVIDWSTPTGKLSVLNRAIAAKEVKKAEREWAGAVEKITDALVAGVSETIDYLSMRFSGEESEDGKQKKLTQKGLDRCEEFFEMFKRRNILGREDLNKMVDSALGVIKGVDIKKLKKDDALKAKIMNTIATVKTSVDKLLVDKPSRRITLGDDDV